MKYIFYLNIGLYKSGKYMFKILNNFNNNINKNFLKNQNNKNIKKNRNIQKTKNKIKTKVEIKEDEKSLLEDSYTIV